MSTSSQPSPASLLVRLFGLDTINPNLSASLRNLATDIDMLVHHGAPDDTVLRCAPLIDQWLPIVLSTGVALIGTVKGHPDLRGPMSITSRLWIVANDLSWVRTTSGFYRLGDMKPADPATSEDGHVH